MPEHACPVDSGNASERGEPFHGSGWLETVALVALFAVYAGQQPPAVNEAHYLTKARHYWDPSWCGRDLFLGSRDAHLVFCWLVGWLTQLLPLPAAAWCGRVLAWSSLAWGWRRLSYATIARPGMSLLSAGLWLAFVEWGNMAGEWVVGGVEAKCFAYAAVFLALESLLRNRWNRGLALFGLATSLHVLVGGWSLVAAAAAWWACGPFRPRLTALLPGVAAALLLALPGLWPALRLTAGTDPQIVAEAEWIYVYGRLSHHLVFHRLAMGDIVRHAGLLLVWVAMAVATPCVVRADSLGQRPLRGFVGGAVVLAVVGAAIDQALLGNWELSSKLLRYYWFRMSDSMLPVGAALAIVGALVRWWTVHPWRARGLAVIAVAVLSANLGLGMVRHGVLAPRGIDPQWNALARWGLVAESDWPRIVRDWQAIGEWIRTETPPDSLFITPRNQQSFKWYAQRAEVVNVKDIPQDATSVVEWQYRRESVYPPETGALGLAGLGEPRLIALARQYGAEYIVVDEFLGKRTLSLPIVYPPATQEAAFRIYRIPVRRVTGDPP